MTFAPQISVDPSFTAQIAVSALIIGGGACGLTCALRLADAGVDSLVIERDRQPLGSTSLSSGFIPAAGTRLQKKLGIADSPEALTRDIQAKAHGAAGAELTHAYTNAIGEALDWLELAHGFQWEVLTNFLYPGHSVHRMHTLPQRQGIALIQALDIAVNRAGGTVLSDALAFELVVDTDRRVMGVRVKRPDGAIESIACKALLLACNGYGGSAKMRERFIPDMSHASFAGHLGNDGSAVEWGEALGARLADMSAYQGHGSWAVPHGSLVTWALMVQGGIQVNERGERFHDESQGYSEAAVHVVAQPNQTAWCIFDEPIDALGLTFPDYVAAKEMGAVKVCEDVSALAAVIGCGAETIGQTLSAIGSGVTDAFSRTFVRGLQAPYYAIRVTGALFHTQGGLDVDASCRVLDVTGQHFPNMWAGGGAARGVSGPDVSGYLSGNGLLSAIAGGTISADSMATFLDQG